MKKVSIVLLSLVLGATLTLSAESSMKCGAGKCGGAKQEKKEAKKDTNMKCGAGKCGKADKKEKSNSKCGAEHMKTNNGKCG